MKDDAEYLKTILPQLAEVMPYKWRVQSFSKFKPQATCVAYIDARDAQDRLDKVCMYGWERDHKEIKEHVYAGVGIVMPSGRMLWRWDCGTESNTEAVKGEASDSFKRAAVNWGVGRFLYDLKIQYVDANAKKESGNYPHVVNNGQRAWDLTELINNKTPHVPKVDTFADKMAKAKKAVGGQYFTECLNGYQCDKVSEVKKEDEEAILADLRNHLKKKDNGPGPSSQSMRNDD